MHKKSSKTLRAGEPAGSLKRLVRRYRLLRLKERIRKGDQFYHYISKIKWKRVSDNTIEIINHFGGVPLHYKGRFRRSV